jgi:DNA-nicking Smr family endonuclease
MSDPFNPIGAPLTDEDFDALMNAATSREATRSAKKEKQSGSADTEQPTLKNLIDNYPKEPKDTLDLHGYFEQESARRAENFLRASKVNGYETVRIITGKGIHSPQGRAIIRGAVARLLEQLKAQGLIFHFKWEQQREQSSGSVLVYLN